MSEEESKLAVPLDKFLAAGVYVGLKYRTKFLKDYIYKIRPDGLAVLNIQKISKRLEILSKFLSTFEPKDILVVCRRDSGWGAVAEFCKVTGAKSCIGRYLSGTMTNSNYTEFFEPKIVFVCDPWVDRNAIKDAILINIPVVGLVDTNNTTNNNDLVLPCNNKGKKSLSLIFCAIAKEILKLRGQDPELADIENFSKSVKGTKKLRTEDKEESFEPRKRRTAFSRKPASRDREKSR